MLERLMKALSLGRYADHHHHREPCSSIHDAAYGDDGSIPDLTEMDFDRMWRAVDPEIRAKAVKILREHLPKEAQERIRRLMSDPSFPAVDELQQGPGRAVIPAMFHFTTGMAIRNLLREEGLRDSALPAGNWDDYYVQALREALTV